jgi:hypothetical protein
MFISAGKGSGGSGRALAGLWQGLASPGPSAPAPTSAQPGCTSAPAAPPSPLRPVRPLRLPPQGWCSCGRRCCCSGPLDPSWAATWACPPWRPSRWAAAWAACSFLPTSPARRLARPRQAPAWRCWVGGRARAWRRCHCCLPAALLRWWGGVAGRQLPPPGLQPPLLAPCYAQPVLPTGAQCPAPWIRSVPRRARPHAAPRPRCPSPAGASICKLIYHKRKYRNHWISGAVVAYVLGLMLFLGATPFVDNWCHLGGLGLGAIICWSALIVRAAGLLGACMRSGLRARAAARAALPPATAPCAGRAAAGGCCRCRPGW